MGSIEQRGSAPGHGQQEGLHSQETVDSVGQIAERIGVCRDVLVSTVAEIYQTSLQDAEDFLLTPPSELALMRQAVGRLERLNEAHRAANSRWGKKRREQRTVQKREQRRRAKESQALQG